jgi:hypothetical protein
MTSWTQALLSDIDHAQRMATDFPYYAEQKLVIRNKAGVLVPFKLNSVQLKLWATIQDQMRRKGRCRLAITKMRQGGLSTMCAGLIVWMMDTQAGTRGLAMGHRDDSASHIHRMIKLFVENIPADQRPALDVDNASELSFKSGSGFVVRVASDDGASARGQTARICHLTEAAYFSRWNDNLDSLTAIVPDLPGTILIAETTADFLGSQYHAFYQRALAGTAGDWEAAFYPWFDLDEYATEPPADFEMAADEKELAALYKLSPAQIYWRRRTIAGYSDPKRFQREYPSSYVEAYQSAEVQESFIDSDDVMRARKCQDDLAFGLLTLGVDVAYSGNKDRAVIAYRRGRAITKTEKFQVGGMELCGILGKVIDRDKPDRVYIDATGGGQIVVDRMHELGYDEVEGVTFSGRSTEIPTIDETGRERRVYHNRRSQIYGNLRDALQGSFRLPDDDALHGELVAIGEKYRSDGAIQLEDKAAIKKRLQGVSIDEADACALSVADGVHTRTKGARGGRPKNFNKPISYPSGDHYA